jgi:hypothetical protein
MLSASDPVAYIKANERLCDEWFVHEPIKNLHVIALLQHLPAEHLLDFDWKESMHEVVPMLARVVRAGPGTKLDEAKLAPKLDAWDRRSRRPAIVSIAKSLKGVSLVEIKTDSDAYSFVAIKSKDRARVATWKKKARLPLAVVA